MNYLGSLAAGYTVEQVLNYLSKNFPELGPRIKEAVKSGKKPKDILEYLGKFDRKQLSRLKSDKKPFEPFPESSNPYIQGKEATKEYDPIPQSLKQAGKAGLVAAAGTSVAPKLGQMASQYIPQASKALQNALPKNILQPQLLKEQLQGLTNESQTMPLPDQNQINTSQQPLVNKVAASIPEPSNIQQPEVISNPKEYLEKKGVLQTVNESLKRGNNPEQVAAELGIKRSGSAKIDPDLLKNIEEYAKTPQSEIVNAPLKQDIELPKEVNTLQKIEKNSLVSSPNGIGEIKEIRNGQAIIDVDGKLHKVKEEDLETSPIPEKELSELYDDLIKGIESETGEDVSRMVQWAGYNPETNTLQFLPHTGKLYKYGNISPKDAALLTDILSTRKSSGANFIGAWKAGSKSPIGAALSKLIKKLQSERGGKGNEYEETHEPIYSAYEPAIQAKKKKKK